MMLGAGLPEQAPQAGAAMTALLRKAPDSNAPIAQECFKLLATLLRSCSSYQVHPLCCCPARDLMRTSFRVLQTVVSFANAVSMQYGDAMEAILRGFVSSLPVRYFCSRAQTVSSQQPVPQCGTAVYEGGLTQSRFLHSLC